MITTGTGVPSAQQDITNHVRIGWDSLEDPVSTIGWGSTEDLVSIGV